MSAGSSSTVASDTDVVQAIVEPPHGACGVCWQCFDLTVCSGCYDSLKAYNDQSQHDQNGMLQYIEAINQTNESLKRTNEALENTNEKLIADFTEVQQKVEESVKEDAKIIKEEIDLHLETQAKLREAKHQLAIAEEDLEDEKEKTKELTSNIRSHASIVINMLHERKQLVEVIQSLRALLDLKLSDPEANSEFEQTLAYLAN